MPQTVFPQLRITDWERSRTFYVDGLGFTVDWEHRFAPGLPVFAQLTRDGRSLFLSAHGGGGAVGGAAYFFVTDVDGWHRDFARRRPRAARRERHGADAGAQRPRLGDGGRGDGPSRTGGHADREATREDLLGGYAGYFQDPDGHLWEVG